MEEIIIGKIEGVNTSDRAINIQILNQSGGKIGIRGSVHFKPELQVGLVYKFFVVNINGRLSLDNYTLIDETTPEETINIMQGFQKASPLSYHDTKEQLEAYIEQIKSPVLAKITSVLVDRYSDLFYTYPAAAKKMHHAYAGGLVYHTLGMLNLADAFLKTYPYLKKDYLYAGAILHDIGKTKEFCGVQSSEYSLEGQLLGHLVIGGIDIAEVAKEFGFEETEEVLILKHMMISHHGIPQFGAAKKPMTAEAMVLWYIDTMDSKFRVIGEELDKINDGEFTEQLGILDRSRIYKTKL